MVLNLALALWAIPPWAETGAALAVVGAQVLGTLLAFVLYLRLANTSLLSATAPRGSDVSRALEQVRAILESRAPPSAFLGATIAANFDCRSTR